MSRRTRPQPAARTAARAAAVPPLYHFGVRLFALFTMAMVVAFWPSYFSRLFEQPNIWFHAHGVALALWLGMLVVQAQLIRTQRRSLHRQLGKLSYVLAPAVVVITTVFIHQRVAPAVVGISVLPPTALHFLALTLLSLIAFAGFYGLAIARRRDAQTHAR